MSQSTLASYGHPIKKAEAGGKFDIRPDTVISRAAEAALPFGRAVTYGTNPDAQAKIVNSAAQVFLGVSLKQQTNVIAPAAVPGYIQYDTMSVLKSGAVWVEVTSDVAAGAPAYVDIANGKFTDVSTSNLAVPDGSFETSALSGGLAVLAIK
jgi:hypothetical protein